MVMREEAKRARQKRVLRVVVRFYTNTAEPVSSSLISKELELSSATVRNIMFELEKLGLLWQPHISAGRIPTDRGYRIYVDSLMEEGGILESNKGYMDDTILCLRSNSIEDVILKASQLCSRITAQTGLALFPTLKIREYLIERLEDKIKDILTHLYDFEDKLHLDGTHYLIEQPEFKDAQKISSVLRILEDKRGLLEILGEDLKDEGVKVHIGSENSALGFDECTLITANYAIDENITGTLGVIGPMRMDYRNVIPTVSRIAESISRIFEEMP